MSTHHHRPPIKKDNEISDQSLVVTAICCVFFVAILALAFLIWYRLSPVQSETIVEAAPEVDVAESDSEARRTVFDEGYSIVLPTGFSLEKREVTNRGYTVYRYRTPEGFQFVFAIVPDPEITRFTPPPKEYSETVIKSIPGLNEELDGELLPQRVVVDSMSANVFRFYEKETFRGVNFTDCMAVIVPGHLLLLKFSGKYGNYNEKDTNIVMEDDWYDSLLSLRRVRESSSAANAASSSGNDTADDARTTSIEGTEKPDSETKSESNAKSNAEAGNKPATKKLEDKSSSDSSQGKSGDSMESSSPNDSGGIQQAAELGLKLAEPKP